MSVAVAPLTEFAELDHLAREIRREHKAAQRAFESAVQHAHRCGCLLVEARALCRHGEWLPWLRKVGVPSQTASVYMRLVRKFPDPGNLPLTIAEALGPVTRPEPKPKPPPDRRALCASLYQVIVSRPAPERKGVRLYDPPKVNLTPYEPIPRDPWVLRHEIAVCESRLAVLRGLLAGGRRDYSGERGAERGALGRRIDGLVDGLEATRTEAGQGTLDVEAAA